MTNPRRSSRSLCLAFTAFHVATLAALGGCVVTVPPRPPLAYTEPQHIEWHETPHEKPVEPPRYSEEARINVQFLNEGMARTVANCNGHFSQLGREAQELGQHLRTQQAGSRNISPTAIVLGFNPASLDRATEIYLFSHDVRAVEMLVMARLESQRRAGERMAQEALEPGRHTGLSREQANRFLQGMESLCQADNIRTIVVQSAGAQQGMPNPSPTSPPIQTHQEPAPRPQLPLPVPPQTHAPFENTRRGLENRVEAPPMPDTQQPVSGARGDRRVPPAAAPLNGVPASVASPTQPQQAPVPSAAPPKPPAPVPIAKPVPAPPAPVFVTPPPKPTTPAQQPAAPANKPKASEPAKAG